MAYAGFVVGDVASARHQHNERDFTLKVRIEQGEFSEKVIYASVSFFSSILGAGSPGWTLLSLMGRINMPLSFLSSERFSLLKMSDPFAFTT